MSNTEILHFDSIHSLYVSPQNDPFNSKFHIDKQLNNVSRIFLKSLEMPINFYNIRNGLNIITIKTNLNNVYSVSIQQANYTTITSLLTIINNAFVGVIPSTTITFSTDSSNTYCICSVTSSTITSFSFVDTVLSKYILGFRNATHGSLTVTAPTCYLLDVDHYVTMYLSNIPCDNTFSNGNLLMSFKIPLNATNGLIYYQAENSSFTQYVNMLKTHQTITYFIVTIYDRFGNVILNNNADYSFSLGIEYEQ